MSDPFYVLESNCRGYLGYKVVWCPDGPPLGGPSTGNYMILADGLRWQEAVDLAKRLRK